MMNLPTENTNHWNVLWATESNGIRTMVLGNNLGELLICNIDNETPMYTLPKEHSGDVKLYGKEDGPIVQNKVVPEISRHTWNITEDWVSATKIVFLLARNK